MSYILNIVNLGVKFILIQYLGGIRITFRLAYDVFAALIGALRSNAGPAKYGGTTAWE
jgi:hypothetical protein